MPSWRALSAPRRSDEDPEGALDPVYIIEIDAVRTLSSLGSLITAAYFEIAFFSSERIR